MIETKFKRRCPKCASEKVLRIIYGLPDAELSKRTDVYLAGCIVTDADPVWHCGNCHWEWGGDSEGEYNKDDEES